MSFRYNLTYPPSAAIRLRTSPPWGVGDLASPKFDHHLAFYQARVWPVAYNGGQSFCDAIEVFSHVAMGPRDLNDNIPESRDENCRSVRKFLD
jgi:hypothetical protein